jgi:hypothetical protein
VRTREEPMSKEESYCAQTDKLHLLLFIAARTGKMDRQGTTRLVVRDHRDQMLLGQVLWYEHAINSLIMEALAVRDRCNSQLIEILYR